MDNAGFIPLTVVNPTVLCRLQQLLGPRYRILNRHSTGNDRSQPEYLGFYIPPTSGVLSPMHSNPFVP